VQCQKASVCIIFIGKIMQAGEVSIIVLLSSVVKVFNTTWKTCVCTLLKTHHFKIPFYARRKTIFKGVTFFVEVQMAERHNVKI
jgi:hypothetical protein